MAQQAMREGDEDAEALVAEAVEYAQQANGALRELAHGILPADLASAGLRGAVASMVERLDLPVRVDLCPERFAAEVEANAYFIVAEALTNIVKHAGAGSAAVTATVEDGELRLEVRDDGVGGADPGGHGLIGIEDRATALGGRFTAAQPARWRDGPDRGAPRLRTTGQLRRGSHASRNASEPRRHVTRRISRCLPPTGMKSCSSATPAGERQRMTSTLVSGR